MANFFLQNQPVFQFAYALSFFVMGLAIALQSRTSSRLELARSLAWLAAFGVTHSLYEWGELFSPVHEAFLSPLGIEILHDVHLVLLSISFTCLLEFGVALLRPLGQGQWLRYVSLGWFFAYAIFIVLILPRFIPYPELWHDTANALARYTIGFPGALLAAYGLREQTIRYIAPLNVPNIFSMLQIAGVTLAVYAVFGGLIPPAVPFFPGNWLNSASFERLFGFPVVVFLTGISLVLAVTIIRALEVFQVEMERRVEAMEQAQILTAERERIARELHDGTIQTAYTAGLLVDSARKLAEPDSAIAGRLDKAVDVLNDVIHDLRRNLVELSAAPTGETLQAALPRLAADPRFRSLVEIALAMDLPGPEQLSPRRTDHVLAIVYEALANVVRHAHARRVEIHARSAGGQLLITIRDDGVGLPAGVKEGYGLRNMQERAHLVGGELNFDGSSQGTLLTLSVPWKER